MRVRLRVQEDVADDLGIWEEIRRQCVGRIGTVACGSFFVFETRPERDICEMSERCRRVAGAFLRDAAARDGRSFWLFLAEGLWRPLDRIRNYKKLWRSALNDWLPPEWPRGLQVAMNRGTEVRFAGLVSVPQSEIESALALLFERKTSGIVLLSPTRSDFNSEHEIHALFDAAFVPPGGGEVGAWSDWRALVTKRCGLGDWVPRVWGEYDDREVHVDLYMPENDVNQLLKWAQEHSSDVELTLSSTAR